MLTPARLFDARPGGSDLMTHEAFLDRARTEREQGREDSSRIALAAYLMARVIERIPGGNSSEEEQESFKWQLDSARRYIAELPADTSEVSHLSGIIEAAALPEGSRTSAVRTSLMAYCYFLEHEGRFEEALEVLADATRTFGTAIPESEFTKVGLLSGRLNRMLAQWEAANRAYRAAAEAAAAEGDRQGVFLSRLGRANVLRGQGNLTAARVLIEQVIEEAGQAGLPEIQGRGYSDLGAVLSVQGLVLESLQAQHEALEHTRDEPMRCRILGDLGITLRDMGAHQPARQAFELVAASRSSFVVRANAVIELMDLESGLGNRVAFERRRLAAMAFAERMPPSMAVDYHFKVGVGLMRFGQAHRAERSLLDALRLAEHHGLNEWFFRVERVLGNLGSCPDSAIVRHESASTELWESPALAEVAAGLQRCAQALGT